MELNLNFNPFPVLQTQRLLLRAPLITDADALHSLRSDEAVLKYLDRPVPASVNETVGFIEMLLANIASGTGVTWIITARDSPQLMGTIGFWRLDVANFRAEIGYMLFPEYHRQGFMREAVTAVTGYGFNSMNLHSIEANCNPANTASMQLLQKCNFVKEAYFKENYYNNGKFLDNVIYSLVNNT